MNYVILIVATLLGVYIGRYLFKSKNIFTEVGRVSEQSLKKEENKAKILEFLQENERVTNDDVENTLNVSDATAERYLDELEAEGKIRQVGATGHAVYYVLK